MIYQKHPIEFDVTSYMSHMDYITVDDVDEYVEHANLLNGDDLLKRVIDECKEYIKDSSFVYKLCISNNDKDKKRKWMVVMQKLDKTITNEKRDNVHNEDYAKFRANFLKVIKIFNVNDPTKIRTSIENVYEAEDEKSIKLEYKIGSIVEADNFDVEINNVCSGGIHYFKTLIAAYYYRGVPDAYTGVWTGYHANGRVYEEGCYIRGIQMGKWIEYDENGNISEEGKYKNGDKDGTWKILANNGDSFVFVTYKNGYIIKRETIEEFFGLESRMFRL